MKASQDAGTKGEKSLQVIASGFFISVRVSRSDFSIFVSAPAASRRDKMSVAKLSLGYGYCIVAKQTEYLAANHVRDDDSRPMAR